MGNFLYTITIYPIEIIIEVLFVFAYKAFRNTGIAIIGVSLLISLITLPLYHIAERIQKKERDTRLRLQDGLQRIKSTFIGDEQYMMVSTYYRQNNYHPLYSLRSSVSLLIQVPFFVAAYRFLSHMPYLQGESFFFIHNLSTPDSLLQIQGISINVLPISMTIINFAAGLIYARGFPLRDKIQLYGLAAFFLVLLYNSPSGLVLYWTCNNIFSLLKNLYYKAKRPLFLLYLTAVALSVGFTAAILITKAYFSFSKQLVLYALCVGIILLPLILRFGRTIYQKNCRAFAENTSLVFRLFFASIGVLWLLSGILVPTNLILSSPIEFAFSGAARNPLSYIGSTALFFFGLLIVWPTFVYGVMGKHLRALLSMGFNMLSLIAIINLFVFKGEYGMISRILLFDEPFRLDPSRFQIFSPFLAALAIVIFVVFVIRNKWTKVLLNALIIMAFTTTGIGAYGAIEIQKEYKAHLANISENQLQIATEQVNPVFTLSRTEENVVVLFLDRAINSYLPMVFEQFPELYDLYSGFTYYPNTVTPGVATLLGAPPIMGGYEYLPIAINERSDELLVAKHNESMLVLPRLFTEAGYRAYIFDPPYSNYKWSDDFTPFKEYPEITVQALNGTYAYQYKKDHSDGDSWGPEYESRTIVRRLPMFSLLKIMPPALRHLLYQEGAYFLLDENTQNITKFIDAYATLYYLSSLTGIDEGRGAYVFLVNDTTHEPIYLEAPEYEPKVNVTNTYSLMQDDDYYDESSEQHFHANIAALRSVGRWLDHLKEEGVYDNTRIIIVSDHGNALKSPAFKEFEHFGENAVVFNSLFLVKDLNSNEVFNIDMTFMTTADVPIMVIENLPVSTINPFTQVDMTSVIDKNPIDLYSILLDPTTLRRDTFTFELSGAYRVHDSIFEESNWSFIPNQSL